MSSRKSSTSSSNFSSRTHRYSKSGIGGAGNFHKASSMLSAPASPYITPRTIGTYSTSIGGAGNVRNLSERPKMSSSARSEREQAQRRAAAKHWHHGIGGAGNKTGIESKRASVGSFESVSVGSNADRLRDGLMGMFGKRGRIGSAEDDSFESLCLKD